MITVVDALAALARGDWTAASTAAERAAATSPDSQLAGALTQFLSHMHTPGVYDEPSAFETFIDNAGNVELYRRTIEALTELHAAVLPRAVLDIGCGDGRVTAGSLGAATTRVELVEPSAELLERAVAQLDRPGIDVIAHQSDVTSFLNDLGDTTGWDLVQSTYALHATQPAERPAILRSLAARTSRLAIVEFDIPAFIDGSPEHIAYLADHYERDVREYRDHPEVVAKFLMPVLVGQLDPALARYTFEQPIDEWIQLLRGAGFTTSTRRIARYWWADAVLISATSEASS